MVCLLVYLPVSPPEEELQEGWRPELLAFGS